MSRVPSPIRTSSRTSSTSSRTPGHHLGGDPTAARPASPTLGVARAGPRRLEHGVADQGDRLGRVEQAARRRGAAARARRRVKMRSRSSSQGVRRMAAIVATPRAPGRTSGGGVRDGLQPDRERHSDDASTRRRPPIAATSVRAYRTTPIPVTANSTSNPPVTSTMPNWSRALIANAAHEPAGAGDRVPAGHRRGPRGERGVVAHDRRPNPTSIEALPRHPRSPRSQRTATVGRDGVDDQRGRTRACCPSRMRDQRRRTDPTTAPQSRNETVVAAAPRTPMMPTSDEGQVEPVDVDERVQRDRRRSARRRRSPGPGRCALRIGRPRIARIESRAEKARRLGGGRRAQAGVRERAGRARPAPPARRPSGRRAGRPGGRRPAPPAPRPPPDPIPSESDDAAAHSGRVHRAPQPELERAAEREADPEHERDGDHDRRRGRHEQRGQRATPRRPRGQRRAGGPDRGPTRPAKAPSRLAMNGAAASAARPMGSRPPRRAIVGSRSRRARPTPSRSRDRSSARLRPIARDRRRMRPEHQYLEQPVGLRGELSGSALGSPSRRRDCPGRVGPPSSRGGSATVRYQRGLRRGPLVRGRSRRRRAACRAEDQRVGRDRPVVVPFTVVFADARRTLAVPRDVRSCSAARGRGGRTDAIGAGRSLWLPVEARQCAGPIRVGSMPPRGRQQQRNPSRAFRPESESHRSCRLACTAIASRIRAGTRTCGDVWFRQGLVTGEREPRTPLGLVNQVAKRSTWQPPVDSRSRCLGSK